MTWFRLTPLACICALFSQFGCMHTLYNPILVGQGELVPRYRAYTGLELWAGRRPVARALSGYHGLRHFVRCVPMAREHATWAYVHTGLQWSITGLALAGSIAGFAHMNIWFSTPNRSKDELSNQRMFPLYGVGVLGLLLFGRLAFAPRAKGHAIDAMNYYNDAKGSLGQTCDEPRTAAPAPSAAEYQPLGALTTEKSSLSSTDPDSRP